MNTDTSCTRQLISELATPMEKIGAVLALVPSMDDGCVPRGPLITLLYVIADYHQELCDVVELWTKDGGPA